MSILFTYLSRDERRFTLAFIFNPLLLNVRKSFFGLAFTFLVQRKHFFGDVLTFLKIQKNFSYFLFEKIPVNLRAYFKNKLIRRENENTFATTLPLRAFCLRWRI